MNSDNSVNDRLFNFLECVYTSICTAMEILMRMVKSLFGEEGVETPPSFSQIFARKVFGLCYFGPEHAKRHFGTRLSEFEEEESRHILFRFLDLIRYRNSGYMLMFYSPKGIQKIVDFMNRDTSRPSNYLGIHVDSNLNGMRKATDTDQCGWYLVPPLRNIMIVVSGPSVDPRNYGGFRAPENIPLAVAEDGPRPMTASIAGQMLLAQYAMTGQCSLGEHVIITSTRLASSIRELQCDPALRIEYGPFVSNGHECVLTISARLLRDALSSSDVTALAS